MSSAVISKAISRIDQLVNEGQFYEAHQAVRTVVARYVRQKKTEAAIQVLYGSAKLLLTAKQYASAGDLVIYVIELYKTDSIPLDDCICSQLCQVLHQFDCHDPTLKVISHDINGWLLSPANNNLSSQSQQVREVHGALGQIFARAGEVSEAEHNLLLGTRQSARVLGDMLYEYYMDEADVQTAGLFAARGVLGYLCLDNIKDALACLDRFLERFEKAIKPLDVIADIPSGLTIKIFESTPLLNFVQLLVLSCLYGNGDLYKRLQVRYSPHLSHAKGFDSSLSKIASLYFGIEPVRPNNMLQGLMSGLLGGGM